MHDTFKASRLVCTPIETVNCTLVTEEQCLTVPGVECEEVADQVATEYDRDTQLLTSVRSSARPSWR